MNGSFIKYLAIQITFLLWCSISYSLDKSFFDEIENKCEVWMWSANYGNINCKSELIQVEENCKVHINTRKTRHGNIECKVDYKFIEKNCEIWVMNWPSGIVKCRLG